MREVETRGFPVPFPLPELAECLERLPKPQPRALAKEVRGGAALQIEAGPKGEGPSQA